MLARALGDTPACPRIGARDVGATNRSPARAYRCESAPRNDAPGRLRIRTPDRAPGARAHPGAEFGLQVRDAISSIGAEPSFVRWFAPPRTAFDCSLELPCRWLLRRDDFIMRRPGVIARQEW